MGAVMVAPTRALAGVVGAVVPGAVVPGVVVVGMVVTPTVEPVVALVNVVALGSAPVAGRCVSWCPS